MKSAVFLDRDGTINEMVYDDTHGIMDSPRRAHQVRLMPHAADFIKQAQSKGFVVVVVTNQPGIAKGTLTQQYLHDVNSTIAGLLASEGAAWDAIYVCTHHPAGGPGGDTSSIHDCDCRKPKPGLLLRAAADLGIDLSSSWMVGDGLVDVQAGQRAGCRTILVAKLTIGQVERFFGKEAAIPDFVASDLSEATTILNSQPDASRVGPITGLLK